MSIIASRDLPPADPTPDTIERIELIHVRDPDAPCYSRLYINGEEFDFEEYDVDPGRGWTIDEWNEMAADMVASASPKVADPLADALDSAGDSEYVR